MSIGGSSKREILPGPTVVVGRYNAYYASGGEARFKGGHQELSSYCIAEDENTTVAYVGSVLLERCIDQEVCGSLTITVTNNERDVEVASEESGVIDALSSIRILELRQNKLEKALGTLMKWVTRSAQLSCPHLSLINIDEL
jgi:hypothetical protein